MQMRRDLRRLQFVSADDASLIHLFFVISFLTFVVRV